MSPYDQDLKVFVSSTSEDLLDYRRAAHSVIEKMDWKADMMENWGAMTQTTLQACFEKLKGCGLMVLIVAHRQGWVPSEEQGGNGQDSITALELDCARKNNIPVLAFLAKDNWPNNLCEDDPTARAWIKKFRSDLNLPAGFFGFEEPAAKEAESLPAFRTLMGAALVKYRQGLIKDEPVVTPTGGPGLDSASAAVRSGQCIPFLGHGIYGDGLSLCSLIKALGSDELQKPCLATVAEYRERFLRSRPGFLSSLEEVITEQSRQMAPPAVHDLLLKVKPRLIVSATEDLMLEQRLAAEGKPQLILCHVIRSADGEHDGKVIVFRGPDDDKPEYRAADNIDLSGAKDSYIIYKPMGSPCLHHLFDPDLEIDTVVMTEADYLIFLGGQKNQNPRVPTVPTAFSRIFQRYPIVFLGFPMDMWHFRLVGRMFQSIGVAGSSSNNVAVRIPASKMEGLAWRRLGLDPLQMDPNEFAKRICETLP
jgi:Domain of unknown function (DUF4062)